MTEEWKTWNFDEWADSYDDWVTSDDPVYARYDEVLRMVVSHAKPSAGRTILDVGTGTGNLAQLLAEKGARVVGLDPSRRMLALARGKGCIEAGIDLCLTDSPFLSIPCPDQSFDAVVSTYAFHHVPRPMQADGIHEMLRVLKPGCPWVMGDLIFKNAKAERAALERYGWMEDEYYARIEELRPVLADFGMDLDSRQFTPVTWVIWATKSTA
ncbi:MAG: class I SAM-dependent methyltransferase [Candidatus Eisenbacteria bacterium]